MTKPDSALKIACVCVMGVILMSIGGCAASSYHNNSFTEIIPATEIDQRPAVTEAVARFATDFDAEVRQLYADGYELVGFAKFTSLLMPQFAERDARITAQARGATLALISQPTQSKLNQHSYMTLFWRPGDPNAFLFGAYYSDLPPNTLGTVGCENNIVLLGPVVAGTPAANMGLAEEDAIMFIDDVPIPNAHALDRALLAKAGQTVNIRYVRAGQRYQTTGKLGSASAANPSPGEMPVVGLSLVAGAIDPPLAADVGRESGVYIDGIIYASRACEAGFRTGDLLLAVNGTEVGDMEEALQAFSGMNGDAKVKVQRGGKPMEVDVAPSSSLATHTRAELREAATLTPWQSAEGRSWTWLTVSGMLASNAAGAYSQAIRDEQARVAEYNRRQAAAAAAAPRTRVTMGSGRRGTSFVTTQSGDIYSVNRRTAAMLRDNPDFYVQAGRRGQMDIYNANGQRVILKQKPSAIPFPAGNTAWLQNMQYGDPLKMVFSDPSIQRGGTTYGQDYSGSSINNPGWANRGYYDVDDYASWQQGQSTATGNYQDRRSGR